MTAPLDFDLDPDTLRETGAAPDLVAARVAALRTDVSTAPDDIAELLARGELVDLLRVSGDLDAALSEGRRAAERAELVGTPAQQHLARLRLAHVQQWRGEFAESTMAFTELLAAAPRFGPVIEAHTCQHAGLNEYDQRLWADAGEHFARARQLREDLELDEAAASRVALDAVRRHAADPHGPEEQS